MKRLVLGIDGGGTRTRAAIADENGTFCGAGEAGPSNYDDVGQEHAQANIQRAVQQARRHAGLEPHPEASPFAAAFLGMAGVVSEKDRQVIRDIAQRLHLAPDAHVGVDHDIRITLAGGLSGRPGIALILGTGSSCYGRNTAGQSWQSGGWGHLISDEGSSYWLGLQAMRCAIGAYDGRLGPTLLLEQVKAYLGLMDMPEIMHRIYVVGLSRMEVAALAPRVIEAAQQGDAQALGLIRRGTQEVSECVLAVAGRLGFTSGRCELALAGGLLNAGEIVLNPLGEAVIDKIPHCQIRLAELSPVLGACLLALDSLGIPSEGAIVEQLQQTRR